MLLSTSFIYLAVSGRAADTHEANRQVGGRMESRQAAKQRAVRFGPLGFDRTDVKPSIRRPKGLSVWQPGPVPARSGF